MEMPLGLVLPVQQAASVASALELLRESYRRRGVLWPADLDHLLAEVNAYAQGNLKSAGIPLGVEDVARILNVSPSRVYQIADELDGIKVRGRWQFDPDDVEHYRYLQANDLRHYKPHTVPTGHTYLDG